MVEAFRQSDEKEKKVFDAVSPMLIICGTALDAFFAGAETAYPLGDVLFNLDRAPLANAVTRETFRKGFFAFFQLFKRPGTFEYYLDVFRAIFGENVDVEFTIPAPGHLFINITALDLVLVDFISRSIVANQYVFDEVLDHEGDNIAFQTVEGIKTQSELDAVLIELTPAGIFVQATLGTAPGEYVTFITEDEDYLTTEEGDTLSGYV